MDLPIRRIRGFGWKRSLPDPRDHVYRLSVADFGLVIPPQASLDPLSLPKIRDQKDEGSCTGFSTAGAIAFVLAREGQYHITSPAFLYYNGRLLEGTTDQDAGAEIRDVIKGAVKLGVCPDETWPYVPGRFALKPSRMAYKIARQDLVSNYCSIPLSLTVLKTAVVKQHAVVFGFSVFESFDKIGADGIMPKPSGSMTGGHAVWIVGYDDNKAGGTFKIANSWGPSWGDHGHFYMPYRCHCGREYLCRFLVNQRGDVMETVNVQVQSGIFSKINWMALGPLVVALAVFFGMDMTPESKASLIITISTVQNIAIMIFRTFYNSTVTPQAARKA